MQSMQGKARPGPRPPACESARDSGHVLGLRQGYLVPFRPRQATGILQEVFQQRKFAGAKECEGVFSVSVPSASARWRVAFPRVLR